MNLRPTRLRRVAHDDIALFQVFTEKVDLIFYCADAKL